MSFLIAGGVALLGGSGAAITAGAVVGGSTLYGAYKGKQQEGVYEEAETAAGQIQQQTLGLLGEQKGIAGQTTQLGYDVAQSQFAEGQRNIGMSANMALRKTQAFGEQAYSQSNLATSGTIEQKMQTQTGDLMAKYKSDMTKLFETRDLSRTQADLSYRKGELSAEEAYESTLTGLESTPTGFWEGAFG